MDLREIGIDEKNWIRLVQYSQMAGFYEHGNETSVSVKKMGYSLKR
jgi:hypothetical protein